MLYNHRYFYLHSWWINFVQNFPTKQLYINPKLARHYWFNVRQNPTLTKQHFTGGFEQYNCEQILTFERSCGWAAIFIDFLKPNTLTVDVN